jgi:hypothetical protein
MVYTVISGQTDKRAIINKPNEGKLKWEEAPTTPKQKTRLMQGEVTKRKGWTTSLVKKLLKDPDEVEHKRSSGGKPSHINWYNKDRVEHVESTPTFKELVDTKITKRLTKNVNKFRELDKKARKVTKRIKPEFKPRTKTRTIIKIKTDEALVDMNRKLYSLSTLPKVISTLDFRQHHDVIDYVLRTLNLPTLNREYFSKVKGYPINLQNYLNPIEQADLKPEDMTLLKEHALDVLGWESLGHVYLDQEKNLLLLSKATTGDEFYLIDIKKASITNKFTKPSEAIQYLAKHIRFDVGFAEELLPHDNLSDLITVEGEEVEYVKGRIYECVSDKPDLGMIISWWCGHLMFVSLHTHTVYQTDLNTLLLDYQYTGNNSTEFNNLF